jgi:[ribosomal protein S5]-alanine N-acetyltransferase
MSKKVTLQNLSTALMKMLNEDREGFQRQAGHRAVSDWPNAEFQEALSFFLALHELHPSLSDWSFLVISEEQIVGEIGAKHPPNQDGAIEVGYGIAASQRRRGFAAEALQAFIVFAFQRPEVKQVIAECLITNQGSIAVLRKLGFACTGEHDSEEGLLFSWELKQSDLLRQNTNRDSIV